MQVDIWMLSRIAKVESRERMQRLARKEQVREALGDNRERGVMRRAVGSGMIRAGAWVAGSGVEIEQRPRRGRRLSSAG